MPADSRELSAMRYADYAAAFRDLRGPLRKFADDFQTTIEPLAVPPCQRQQPVALAVENNATGCNNSTGA